MQGIRHASPFRRGVCDPSTVRAGCIACITSSAAATGNRSGSPFSSGSRHRGSGQAVAPRARRRLCGKHRRLVEAGNGASAGGALNTPIVLNAVTGCDAVRSSWGDATPQSPPPAIRRSCTINRHQATRYSLLTHPPPPRLRGISLRTPRGRQEGGGRGHHLRQQQIVRSPRAGGAHAGGQRQAPLRYGAIGAIVASLRGGARGGDRHLLLPPLRQLPLPQLASDAAISSLLPELVAFARENKAVF